MKLSTIETIRAMLTGKVKKCLARIDYLTALSAKPHKPEKALKLALDRRRALDRLHTAQEILRDFEAEYPPEETESCQKKP